MMQEAPGLDARVVVVRGRFKDRVGIIDDIDGARARVLFAPGYRNLPPKGDDLAGTWEALIEQRGTWILAQDLRGLDGVEASYADALLHPAEVAQCIQRLVALVNQFGDLMSQLGYPTTTVSPSELEGHIADLLQRIESVADFPRASTTRPPPESA